MRTRRSKGVQDGSPLEKKPNRGKKAVYVSQKIFKKIDRLKDSMGVASAEQVLEKLVDAYHDTISKEPCIKCHCDKTAGHESEKVNKTTREPMKTRLRNLKEHEEIRKDTLGNREEIIRKANLNQILCKDSNEWLKASQEELKPNKVGQLKRLSTEILQNEIQSTDVAVKAKVDIEGENTLPLEVKRAQDPVSHEHQQSQIALVLLSMSQAHSNPKPIEELPSSNNIKHTEGHVNDTFSKPKQNTPHDTEWPKEKDIPTTANSSKKTKVFNCEKCTYQTNKRGDLNTHVRIHTGLKPYTCKQCPATFRQQHHLKYHELTHTNTFNFNCTECTKSFRTSTKLKIHMKKHPHVVQLTATNLKLTKKDTVFKCGQCNYQALAASDLRKHSNCHSTEKNFECEFCDFSTSWKKNLRIHRMRHTGEAPYKCRDCGFATYDSHALRRHKVKIHLKDQAFVCESCGTAFTQKKLLVQHQVIHTGEKPYKCPHCDYSAGYRSNLRSHLLMHNPKKGFVCEDCGRAFRQKQHLSSHRINKHSDPNKVYLCQICGFSSSASQSLNSHMRVHSANAKKKTLKKNTTSNTLLQINQAPSEHQVNVTPNITVANLTVLEAPPRPDTYVKEHNYSTHHQSTAMHTTHPDGLTPAQVEFLALETASSQATDAEIPNSTDNLCLTVGSQLLQAMVREGEMSGLADTISIQDNHVHEGIDNSVSTSSVGENPALGGHVPDQIVYNDQQGNPLFQYEGMAAVLSHIMPDFNYQS